MVALQVEETTILELSARMSSGEITALSLTEHYLERIQKIDRSGPSINSIIETNPDALEIAAALDKERAAGKLRGPLHGIPILVKDNIDTHDRMQTASGSLALEGSIASRDAFLVRRLRSAGAVILGKANLSEWANFRGKRSVSGWSSRGGLTRNPYALDRSACGSSSGSAAAVSAALCAGAIGTETDGSIICPSQTCGVVGLKPTLGLISRSGIIPIAHSQDTAGPIGRTVEDVAVMLECVTGIDAEDRATLASEKRLQRDYTKFLVKDGLKGKRIGVARNMLGTDKRTTKILEDALDVMKQLGAVIIDPADLPNWDEFGKSEIEVLYYEFKADLNKYLRTLGPQARVHSLEEIIKFNEDNRSRIMPYFGQERMLAAQEKEGLTSRKYREALAKNHRLTRTEGIDALMVDKQLDAVVVVSGGPAWMIDLANGDPSSWDMESTSPAAVAGYPHITVPAGEIFGLPVGISFFARAWQDSQLLKYAYAFEQASPSHLTPHFKPSIDMDSSRV